MYGGIGDTARGRRERAEGAGVNYLGLNVRRKTIWLPFVDTYRTLCLAPPPEVRVLFQQLQVEEPFAALPA